MKLVFIVFLSPFLLLAQTFTSVELGAESPWVPVVNISGSGFTSGMTVRVFGTAATSTSISPTLIRASFDSARIGSVLLADSIAGGALSVNVGNIFQQDFHYTPAPNISYVERPNGGSLIQIVGSRIDSNVRMFVWCGSERREFTSFTLRPGIVSYNEPVCEQESYSVSLGVTLNVLGIPRIPSNASPIRLTGVNLARAVSAPPRPFPSAGELLLSSARITVGAPNGPGPVTHTVDVEGRNFTASTRVLVNGTLTEPGTADLSRTPQRISGRFTSSQSTLSATPTVGLLVAVGVTGVASNMAYSNPFGYPRLDGVTMLSPIEFRANGEHLEGARFQIHCGPNSAIAANIVRPGPVFATGGCPQPTPAGFPVVTASRELTSLWQLGSVSSGAVALPRPSVAPNSLTLAGSTDSPILATLNIAAPIATRFRVASVPWLTATPSSGTTPATVELRASNGAEGSFSGNVDVVFESSSGSTTIAVPVTLRVAGRPATLSLPHVPELFWRRGEAPPSLQIPVLGDTTSPAVAFTMEQRSGQGWITAANPQGGAPAVVNFRVTPERLAAGEHIARFVLRAPQSSRPETEFAVGLRVRDGEAPLAASLRIVVGAGSAETIRLLPLPGPSSTTFTVEKVGDVPWLSLPANSFRGNGAAPLTISPGSLTPGIYFAELKVTSSASPRELRQRIELVVPGSNPALTVARGKVLVQLPEPNAAGAMETVGVWPENAAWSTRTRVLTPAAGNWLQARRSGSAVEITTLPVPAGRYFGAVEILDANGAAQAITVELLSPSGFDAAPLAPSPMLMVAEEGGAAQVSRVPVADKVQASVLQAVALNGEGQAWLSVVAPIVQKARDQAGAIQLRADPAGLAPGVYHATLVMGADTSLQYSTPVTFLVRRSGAGRLVCNESADPLAAVLVLPPGSRARAVAAPSDLPVGVRLVDPCGEVVTPASGVAQSVNLYNHADAGVYSLAYNGEGVWTGVIPVHRGVQFEVQAHVLRASGVLQSTSRSAPRWTDVRAVTESEATPWLQGVSGVATGSPLSVLSPGAMASVFGLALALPNAGVAAPAGELPEVLAGAAIYLGDRRMKLQYGSAQQVNLLVPLDHPVGVVVPLVAEWNGRLSAPWPVAIAGSTPAILQSGNQGAVLISGAPVVVGLRGQSAFGLESRPARVGDALTIYAVGLGAVTNPPAYGGTAPTSPPFATVTGPLRVRIDERETAILFAGLSPGFIGLYQVNVVVPIGTREGLVPLRLEAGGIASPTILIAIE